MHLCTMLFRDMNYKLHLPVPAAAKLAATSWEVARLGWRYLHLSRMALHHRGIHPQALNEQAVRNIVGNQRQRNSLALLYGDLGWHKREALGMNLNSLLLPAHGDDWRHSDKQSRCNYGKS